MMPDSLERKSIFRSGNQRLFYRKRRFLLQSTHKRKIVCFSFGEKNAMLHAERERARVRLTGKKHPWLCVFSAAAYRGLVYVGKEASVPVLSALQGRSPRAAESAWGRMGVTVAAL